MAIDAKVSFMHQLQEGMADALTVEQMKKLEQTGYRLLDRFQMDEIVQDAGTDDLLDSYVAAMRVECRSQKTIDRYIYVMRRLLDYAKVPLRQISVYHIRNYLSKEKERGICDTTLEGYRLIYSAIYNWLQRENLITRNPTVNLGTIKCGKREKRTYTEVELERLNRSCESIRDRAILHFLRSTGCRISEMVELDRDTVDVDALECIVHGKGDKERTVYMDAIAGDIMKEYLAGRKDDCPALFANRNGERFMQNGIRCMLKKLAKKAGVEHVHPHKFRRTLATNLTRHGMPIQEVAHVMGHEKLDTTMQYVILDKETTKSQYRRFA